MMLRVRRLFLIGMALVWFTAFVSLGVQIDGLAGPDGIAPAGQFLDAVREGAGGPAPLLVPTLCWWVGTGSAALVGMCVAGAILAVLLAAGIVPGLASLLLWVLYLSLTVACTDFLAFQWDMLLLEAGLLAIFLAPWKVRARGLAADRPPSRGVILLFRLLLFKLVFLSGVVKLTSGDPTWRSLTALDYHYWTTCLPTWTGWWVDRLPPLVDRLCVAGMFVLELGSPWLLLVPRPRVRAAGVACVVALQLGIAATGNYGFFNLLTIVLCIPALDDSLLPGPPPEPPARVPFLRRIPSWLLVAVVLPLSLGTLVAGTVGPGPLPGRLRDAMHLASPFRSVNGYGLFASMTTSRHEVVVEGSADGRTWREYRFRWKPGDPAGRPRFMQPHMPRLDWQMWFVALRDWRGSPIFHGLERRLLEGSPPVLALLAENPFPDGPPRYLRATLWDYRLADAETHAETGAWWTRQRIGAFGPELEMVDGEVRAVR